MALSIKSERADQLARELARVTGESLTDAVVASLEIRLEVEQRRRSARGIDDIVERFAALEVVDDRDEDDVIGYDRHGLPT